MSEPHRIRCAEIWGGITLADTDVCTRGLSASIFSRACGGAKGGDIYYFSVCSSDRLSRLAVADMRGHGAAAAQLSEVLLGSLQRRMNTLDGAGVLSDLNAEVHGYGYEALTTAAVLSYYASTSRLYFSYAGHPPALIQMRDGVWDSLILRRESPGANLPLGVFPGSRYDQDEVVVRPGDRLFVCTDGVLECPNSQGEEFGLARLLTVLNESRTRSLTETKGAVALALHEHAGGVFTHDDCTFMAIEVIASD